MGSAVDSYMSSGSLIPFVIDTVKGMGKSPEAGTTVIQSGSSGGDPNASTDVQRAEQEELRRKRELRRARAGSTGSSSSLLSGSSTAQTTKTSLGT